MKRTQPGHANLTPEELESLMAEHIQGFFDELRATGDVMREQYHPVKLVKRHPLLALAVVGVAVYSLVHYIRRRPAKTEGEATSGGGGWTSFLAGLASTLAGVLPGLIAARQAQKQDQQ
jgi:hypothetical protein